MNLKTIAIFALVLIVVAAGVGYGAYTYGAKAGEQRAVAARTTFFQERAGAMTGATTPGAAAGLGQGAGAGRGAAAINPDNFANGQVKSVSGNVIELSTAREVLKIKVSDKTQIQKTVSGAVSDLQVGERITVHGERAADGSLDAQSIQIGVARMFGGAGGQ